MLSDKHIDSKSTYEKLAVNVGIGKKEIKKSKADNIETAINQVIAKIPGAEYLTNVKIYAVRGNYLAVSGDAWGKDGKNLISPKTGEKVASISK